MAFSDDEEEEALIHSVSNYYFNDEKDEAVCFSQLPLQFGGKECLSCGSKKKIFLRGIADDGLLTICKHVTTWKFDLSNVGKPDISVLSKDIGWLKLQKPRKSFEPVIRSVLISVHCLHLISWNPDLSGKSLWDQLAKIFSLYEVKPSQNDLVDHMDLIAEAVKSDDSLAKSKFLHSFLEEKPKKRKLANENARATSISGFIVDDAVDGPELDDSNNDDDDNDDDEDDLYDSVCAFCDNGGSLICCDGRCMRSFHATEDDDSARESACESLGFTPNQVKALETLLCKNCEYNQHQCFACGKLGSSDKSSGAEVFRCSNATCGHFYHPHCVAKLLHKGDKVAAEEHAKRISSGEFFTCPTHKCCACQQGENKKVEELQFALCRRCPTSYHRKCLPREIAFDDIEEEGIITRAWDGLLVNRVLIYCLKHEIDEDLGTPIRDHIKFPFDESKKRKASDVLTSHEKVGSKKKTLALEGTSQERTAMKAAKQSSSVVKADQTSKKSEKVTPRTNSLKKVKATGPSKKPLRQNSKSLPMDAGKSSAADGNKASLGGRLFALMNQESEQQIKPGRQDNLKGGLSKAAVVNSTATSKSSDMPSLDADSERRLLNLMKEAESSVTLEDIITKPKVLSTHGYSSRSVIDRTITLGKIEGLVEAVQMALAKLEDGCSIEDAQAVCEPEVLNQIFKWQNKLRVYLAPFLYGMRYSSFGRHFTKVDKLEEIVDRVHWYVQDGDTIVDFCCGANDFSLIMKRKLEETGKKCSFKNYDIFQAKNDFNFERRDWMSVQQKELPTGSKLIMGLNPPFGVKAALANKFIDKALEFNPKLLILIVPPETERLDKKKFLKYPYELVWEDNNLLSGKSFYLPGSIDANDKQMDQWNVMAPPLYLWSRSDFSAKNKSIAEKHGHVPREPASSNQEMNIDETRISDFELPLEDDGLRDDAAELKDHMQNHEIEERKKEKSVEVTPKECSPPQQNDEKNQSKETSSNKKRKHSEENDGRKTDKKSGGQTPRSETHDGIPHSSPFNVMGSSRSSVEGASSKLHSEENLVRKTDIKGGGRTPRSEMHSGIPHSSPSNVMGSSRSSVKGASPKLHSEENLGRKTDKMSGGRTPRSETHGGIPHSSPYNVMGSSRSSVEGASSKLHSEENLGRKTNKKSGRTPRSETYSGIPHSSPSNVMGSIRSSVECASRSPNQHRIRNMHSSQTPLQTSYGDTRTSVGDDMGRRYHMNYDPYSAGTHSHGYRPYPDEMNREFNLRSQVHLYGQEPGLFPRRNDLAGLNSLYGPRTPSYGQHNSATVNPSYRMNMSAMQRYAPRLDELNYTRMGGAGPEPPLMGNRNAFYDPRPPFMIDPRAPRPPYTLGFSPGPYHPYSHHNSAG
ncbi:hypothetical protein ES332_A01G101400v1 [Gossypium tomentosum]|uniref:Zinc finger PHD-type domain-containing protein n=1 Tax=Gossypium tomentosum TaxID=34277 RepID=A0A5D2RPS6_GOSTO|nr:hypothetical protein ES332_A01G101400v1 [Gossypium tomentosum]